MPGQLSEWTMIDDAPLRVAIECLDESRRTRWSQCLVDPQRFHLVAPSDAEVRLVSTDPAAERWEIHAASGNATADPVLASGDESLPAEAWQTLLQLAGQIVRLRRTLDSAESRQSELFSLSRSDPLTGAANRRAWDDWRGERRTPLVAGSLAIVDVDRLKQVNETQGYPAGDTLLRDVVRALKQSVRPHDRLARLGGDEFVLWLVEVDPRQAAAIWRRVGEQVHSQLASGVVPGSISLGYAVVEPGTNDTLDGLFERAQLALRAAKQAGGDQARGAE